MEGSEHVVGLYRTGPRWDEAAPLGKQSGVQEHIAYLVSLLREGKAQSAGPFHRPEDRVGDRPVGLILFSVSYEEARRLAEADPAVACGLMVCDVLPWYP